VLRTRQPIRYDGLKLDASEASWNPSFRSS
jgi:hypothetical protein